MARNESSCKFSFGSKSPLFMLAEGSSCDDVDDRIEIEGKECMLGFELSRENLKKLYCLIQGRLKGERCHFTEDNKFIRHAENGEIQEIPAADILRSV